MASIRVVARNILEDARDGIAWIAFYKEGRGWNAACFWPDIEQDGTLAFDADDPREIRAILAIDSNAIFVNGYYSNLGSIDGMTRDSLAAALRWQYENQYNQLAEYDFTQSAEKEEQAADPSVETAKTTPDSHNNQGKVPQHIPISSRLLAFGQGKPQPLNTSQGAGQSSA